MPSSTELQVESLNLHKQLLAKDPTASARIAEMHLPDLVRYLSRKNSKVDEHLVEMAADDAMMDYLEHPERYDPSKLPLDRYLRMAARYDLLNHIKKAKSDDVSSKFESVVELDAVDVEHEIAGRAIENEIEYIVDRFSPLWHRLAEVIPDPVDQEFVLLMMDNVRDTERYAEVLGITLLSKDEQAIEVKRNKDRIKKRLQRKLRLSELVQHD